MKTLATYTPIGLGKMAAVESVINFDWSLGGSKPAATHGSALIGIVQISGNKVEFILIAYALDEADSWMLRKPRRGGSEKR